MERNLRITGWNPIIHSTTFASFSFFVLHFNHVQPGIVRILPENGNHKNDRQSELANNYIKWLEKTEEGSKKYQCYLKGNEKIVKCGKKNYKVDAYHSMTVIEIMGYFYHGCPTVLRYVTNKEVYEETMKMIDDLRRHPSNYEVKIVWEHDIRREETNNKR